MAIGIHPKMSKFVRESDIRRLERLLTLHGVVAIGDVGLDYSVPADYWADQHCMLDTILQPNYVLVLHCRGISRNTSQRGGCMMQLFCGARCKVCALFLQRISREAALVVRICF